MIRFEIKIIQNEVGLLAGEINIFDMNQQKIGDFTFKKRGGTTSYTPKSKKYLPDVGEEGMRQLGQHLKTYLAGMNQAKEFYFWQ